MFVNKCFNKKVCSLNDIFNKKISLNSILN